jgi:rhamnosyltransferase
MMSSPLTRQGICASVITFNPDQQFFEHFPSLCDHAKAMIIVDNGSTHDLKKRLESIARQHGAHFISNDANMGIAAALNIAVQFADSLDYRWLVFFDQDSIPICDMRKYFLQIYAAHPERDMLAIIGSKYIDTNRTPATNKESFNTRLWTEKKTVITSGSLISLDAYDALGPFQEELFIDMVDREYCYRARSKGFHVVQSTRPLISHSIGSYKAHNLFGKTVWMSNHSALRRYFMIRNRLIVQKKYTHVSISWRLSSLRRVIKQCIYVCLFETDKIAKANSMLTGWWHGINGITTPPQWIRRQVGYTWKKTK